MRRTLTALVLSVAAFASNAAPITFGSSRFQTSAAVIAGGSADAQFGSSPPTALPLVTVATVLELPNFASANGIGAAGLLATAAEVDGNGIATAVGTSEFDGSFVSRTNRLDLSFNFSALDAVDPGAFGATTLVLIVLRDGQPFFSELFNSAGAFARQFDVAINALYTIDFLLSSEANTFSGGSAFSSGGLTFQATAIPEPSTVFLLVFAAAGLLFVRRYGAVVNRDRSLGLRA